MVGRREFLRIGAAATIAAAFNPKAVFASANGRRSLCLYNSHTKEELTAEYCVDGWYNPDVLARFDNLLRDWRTGEVMQIDPHLLDILHHMQNFTGATGPLHVVSGYRSPETNAKLARMMPGVAKNSFHMKGKAVDIRMPGYSSRGLRQEALALKAGGVGYYPRSDFVHLDTGPIRAWKGPD